MSLNTVAEETATPTCIVSLTDAGQQLAARLTTLIPAAHHLHRPQPFAQQLQARFRAGERLLCICASGIVMRSLAPVLRDKHHDPSVLLIDEAGEFVVPLLSGHEGGGYAWGNALASALEGSSQCVVTGAQQFSRRFTAVGMGCERNCPREHLDELLQQGLEAAPKDSLPPEAIASIALKADEPGLLELARLNKLPSVFFDAAALNRYRSRLRHPSEVVYRETGCYGVAEAAALAAVERISGAPARLLVPKIKTRRATFALASGFLPTP